MTFVRSTNLSTPLTAVLGGFAKVVLTLNMVVKKNEALLLELSTVVFMTCCCASCDARMIELVQAIDDLRRSLVIALQESRITKDDTFGDRYYWEHG